MSSRAADIGRGWAGSLTMGAGQFCTNPGVVVALGGAELGAFEAAAVEVLNASENQLMLTENIAATYALGVDKLSGIAKRITAHDNSDKPCWGAAAAFRTEASFWLNNEELQHEVFGASGIIVECASVEEMASVAEQLDGQLTVTLQLDSDDHELAAKLLPTLEEKAGRLLCNGFPTGVEVCSAMMHGGPYPASTDVRSTSVGTLAITRWLRPVSYQNFPGILLHEELR